MREKERESERERERERVVNLGLKHLIGPGPPDRIWASGCLTGLGNGVLVAAGSGRRFKG